MMRLLEIVLVITLSACFLTYEIPNDRNTEYSVTVEYDDNGLMNQTTIVNQINRLEDSNIEVQEIVSGLYILNYCQTVFMPKTLDEFILLLEITDFKYSVNTSILNGNSIYIGEHVYFYVVEEGNAIVNLQMCVDNLYNMIGDQIVIDFLIPDEYGEIWK